MHLESSYVPLSLLTCLLRGLVLFMVLYIFDKHKLQYYDINVLVRVYFVVLPPGHDGSVTDF